MDSSEEMMDSPNSGDAESQAGPGVCFSLADVIQHEGALSGQALGKAFWGRVWNNYLQSFEGSARRASTARGMIRTGHVRQVEVSSGRLSAQVTSADGDRLHRVELTFPQPNADALDCFKALQGASDVLSEGVLRGDVPEKLRQALLDGGACLIPAGKNVEVACDCSSTEYFCIHSLAALYAVSVLLDRHPEALFTLLGMKLGRVPQPVWKGNSTGDDLDEAPFGQSSNDGEVEQLARLASEHLQQDDVQNPYMVCMPPPSMTPPMGMGKCAEEGDCWSGERVQRLRRRLKLTQGDFGKRLDVSTTTVSFWEREILHVSERFLPLLKALEDDASPLEPRSGVGAGGAGCVDNRECPQEKVRAWTGRRVAALRRRGRMTLEELALKIGVTFGTVSNWEHCRCKVSPKYNDILDSIEKQG